MSRGRRFVERNWREKDSEVVRSFVRLFEREKEKEKEKEREREREVCLYFYLLNSDLLRT